MTMLRSCVVGILLGGIVTGAPAATIVLKDGSIVEGKIITETSTTIRVRTFYDVRLIRRREIDKIFDDDASSSSYSESVAFNDLPETARALLNARADYKLDHYSRVIERVQPFAEKETHQDLRSEYQWLIIESQERLARWNVVYEMLEEMKKKGTERDRLRAQAHLDILDDNKEWDYSLRRVDKAWARNFLPDKQTVKDAQDPDALARVDLMRKALEEYCSQLVRDEKSGAASFRDRLDPRKTIEAIQKLPPNVRSDDVVKRMPYYDELLKAETSIHKAQAVLPGYADAFILDLVRAEGDHLVEVLFTLLSQAERTSPFNLTLPRDARGQITPQARQQWRQACDAWLEQTAPAAVVGEYFRDKIMAYPKQLSLVEDLFGDVFDRLTEMRASVYRQRGR